MASYLLEYSGATNLIKQRSVTDGNAYERMEGQTDVKSEVVILDVFQIGVLLFSWNSKNMRALLKFALQQV